MSTEWEQNDQLVSGGTDWEQGDEIIRASFPERAVGAVAKGEMAVGQAILRAPAMVVKQYSIASQAVIAGEVLREIDPERQAALRQRMADTEQTFDKVAKWLSKPAELHKVGRKIIEQNHPEWESDPPKNFVDLLTNPDKLGIAVAESMPILVNAGILTLAGHPNLAMGMMYVTEGQQAADQAIQDGASEGDAAIAYAIYGSVSAALEKMQLEGLLKIGKGSYNALLNRTVQKVAGRGLRHATWDIIKVAAQEGLEELSQGAWGEITAKLVYDKSVPDGVAGFIDRRAQEAYLGFMIGLIPGVAGGVAGAVKGRGQVQEPGVAAPEAITEPEEKSVDQQIQELREELEADDFENPGQRKIAEFSLRLLEEGQTPTEVEALRAGVAAVPEAIPAPPEAVGEVVEFKPVKEPMGGFSYGRTLYRLPPVKEGMVRLYRAETGVRTKTIQGDIEDFGQDDKGTGGWFTTDFGYALNFYEGAYGKTTADRKMVYMDVSEQSAKEHFQGTIEAAKHEYFYPELRQVTPTPEAVPAPSEAVAGQPPVAEVVEGVGEAKTTERGKEFETGKSVTFEYIRNTQKAPDMGERFQQHLEPTGKFMQTKPLTFEPMKNMISGEITFKNPLVVEFNTGEQKTAYDENNWKARLSKAFGNKTGTELSKAITYAGYDGIITIGQRGETSEIVDLIPTKPEPIQPKPPRMSRRKLLKLGHQLPKKLGWGEAQRRDFMQQTIGKTSMKGMTPKEMKALVVALQGEAREAGVLPPEDYQKTLFIGTREVKTEEFFEGVLAEVENLKGKAKKKPKIITRKGQRRKRGLLKTAKAIGVGIDNLSIPHLIRKIGGAVDGLLKEVGVTNYRRSIHRISSVFRGGVDQLNAALDKAKVTPNDLAEMSQQLDPRLTLIQRGRELVGKPKTKQHTVKLNDKQFSLSMAELLDIYLSAQQEEGMGHIEKAGLKIFGEKTGPLTKEQLQPLLDLVTNDPKAKAFADAVVKISDEYNAPQLNYTHSRVNPEVPEKLADKENYWHLNVDRPLRIKGKGTYSISLLENKSILKPRKGPKGALIVGDAFSKFFSVQYAVAEYVGMAEELRLLNMVLNYEPIITELESKGYGDVRNNLKQLIEWVQDPKSSTVRADKLVSKILHGSYRAVLHFSPEVILSQYMSTGHYAGVVDPKYVPLLSVPPTPKLIKEMLEHNPVVWMRNRAGGQSAELAETGQLDASLRLLTGKRADLNKTGIAAQMTDLAAFGQGWKVAKAFVEDTTQLKKGSPEYWDAVSDKAEELWDTQPSWDKWNKSINTSQRGIKRLPFLFRSYFEKSLMMLSTANETYKIGKKTTADKAKWSQVYGAVIGSQMMTALIRTFVGHALWRKRKSVWDYIGAMVAAPLVMVSVVGGYMNRVVGNVFRILAGEKQKFEGEPISNLATSTLEKFFLGIGQTTKAAAFYLAGEEDKAEVQIKAATRNLILSIGTMKGVPVRQIEKIGKAIETEDVPKSIGGYI
jgi:hypothetical protein